MLQFLCSRSAGGGGWWRYILMIMILKCTLARCVFTTDQMMIVCLCALCVPASTFVPRQCQKIGFEFEMAHTNLHSNTVCECVSDANSCRFFADFALCSVFLFCRKAVISQSISRKIFSNKKIRFIYFCNFVHFRSVNTFSM